MNDLRDVTHVIVGEKCSACRGTGLVYVADTFDRKAEPGELEGCGACSRRRYVTRAVPLDQFVALLREELK